MRFSFVTNAAAVVAGLALTCLVVSNVAVAKRAAVPLPDVNPNRSILPVRAPNAVGAPETKASEEKKISEEKKSSEEKKLFDARGALEPLLEYKLAKKDRYNLKSAINAVYKGHYPAALGAMKRITDRSAHKLALWYYYRSSGLHAKAADIEAFRIANPHWPGQARLKNNAERSLFVNKASAAAIKAFFAESGPNTGAGKAALAAMHLAEGEEAKAKAKIGEAWRNYILTKRIEKLILERFPGMLTDADHKTRVDKLLYQDRKSRIASALRAASHLSKAQQKKIAARVAIVRRSKTAGKLLKDIPAEPMKADIGFYFSRIQWLRRRDKDEEAWELLQATPNEPSQLLDLNEWWIERRVNARRALNAGHPETAYEIASNHGPITGKHYAEAQFLAGWITLRFLGQHENAEKHFLALRTSALTPKQIARAEYWLGRATEAVGRMGEAATHYANAARYPLTYYGQLASHALSNRPGILWLWLDQAPIPSKAAIERFQDRDAVRAIAIARATDHKSLVPLFLHHLARTLTSPEEAVLLAELARAVGQPYAGVRLGKIALNRGLPTADYAFPIGMLPDYKQLSGTVEPAFLHALSRQESEFNPKARSPVGASGLMQLMPRTARMVARQYKVRYRRSQLTKDPSYNVMLGAAFLSDLLEKYDGSYILSLVAYNAGGSRAVKWMEQFGDPRKPEVDAIDWVERIPFTETRNYVKKILTTAQIYRARLNGPQDALRLIQDLNRESVAPEPGAVTGPGVTAIAAEN